MEILLIYKKGGKAMLITIIAILIILLILNIFIVINYKAKLEKEKKLVEVYRNRKNDALNKTIGLEEKIEDMNEKMNIIESEKEGLRTELKTANEINDKVKKQNKKLEKDYKELLEKYEIVSKTEPDSAEPDIAEPEREEPKEETIKKTTKTVKAKATKKTTTKKTTTKKTKKTTKKKGEDK